MESILSVKLDYIFKLLFGDERNVDILADFLSAVLSVPRGELSDIQILDTVLKKEYDDDKLGILDVNIKTRSGMQINLEIQVINKKDFEKRTMYYTSKRLIGQLGEGDPYTKLCHTITINIIDFDMFEYEKYHGTFYMMEEEEGTRLTDIVRIDFLELQKAKKSKDKDMKRLWMDFINAESEADLRMLEQNNEAFKRPVAEVIRLSGNAAIRAEYDARQKAIRDRKAEIAYGEELGIAKGMAEGMAKGREEGERKKALEMAKELYLMGLSTEQIIRVSGLPPHDVEKIIK